MDKLEKTAKTVDEAISLALQELGAKMDEVEISILDQGNKGFFGIGSRPAKILATVKFNPVNIAKKFLLEILSAMGIEAKIQTQLKDRELKINIVGKDMGVLIGKRGQTLDSLQYLTSLVVNKGYAPYVGISLDTENYKQRRRETLEALAANLAQKAKQTKKNIILEPMNPYERRIIHSTLQNNRFVTTHSEGTDPHRFVVIVPNKDAKEKNKS